MALIMRTNFAPTHLLKEWFTKERAFCLLVMAICIFGFFNAFRFAAASLDYYTVRNILANWKNDNQVTQEQFIRARETIDNAMFWHSSHPLYRDLSGEVQEWGVLQAHLSQESLLAVKDDYIQATKMRPSWPVTWASLAIVKWRLQEFDEEMLTYLNAADKLGDRTPEVHVLFSQLGLALYQANHPFYRNIAAQTPERVIFGLRHTRSRGQVLAAIKQHDAFDTACNWSRADDSDVYEKILRCE
jgi:hypothetical protein